MLGVVVRDVRGSRERCVGGELEKRLRGSGERCEGEWERCEGK